MTWEPHDAFYPPAGNTGILFMLQVTVRTRSHLEPVRGQPLNRELPASLALP